MNSVATDLKPAALRDFRHSLPMELLKAREAAMTRFRPMLRGHGLTEQQWRVLRVLAACDRLDAGQLARRSLLLAPSLTRILKDLGVKKLVKRSVDKQDQRRSVLMLTASGRKTFARVAPDAEILYRQIESEFGKERLRSLYDLLSDFRTALDGQTL